MLPAFASVVLVAATGHLRPSPSTTRRAIVGAAFAAAAGPPLPAAQAIVNGQSVTDAEAASRGVVGLYIDLTGCTVCRKGVPATCTGTLIAPDLVLTARHCADVPAALNGTLQKVVFAADMLQPGAPSREIEAVVSTADYGIDAAGNDLLLLKLRGAAPAGWRPVELPLALLPTKGAEESEARRRGSPFYPDGVGMPTVVSYGYGQQSSAGEQRPDQYSAGSLKKLALEVRTEVRPWGAGFLTTPSAAGTGTCAGDSGGGALLTLRGPRGELRQLLLGVQAAASKPCVDNQAIFVYPQAFAEFIAKGSRDLGSPVGPGLGWKEY